LKGEAGDVVIPAGKPESVTATEPLNPFAPVIVAVKFEFEIPAFAVIAAGDRAMLNVGTVPTVSVSALECDKDPELPVAVTV
jgi:hypothetical protein